ncbi:adenylosuccinate lyase [Candidatus Bathyarchaeota archaeon]|nr:MAG: adenylosuccinate lyase [Candidatus Bathyarchaeota archaeon]
MPILPIDAGRYGTPEMRKVFEEETRLQKLLDVEAALIWALGEVGLYPKEKVEKVLEKASTKYVKPERVAEIERKIKHDVMAVVEALAEACGEEGGFIHFGATSNDILDTATALQFKDALTILETKLWKLEEILMSLTEKHKKTLMIGRTHGQHALPITLGLKFAVWMREISRYIQRLEECKKRVLVGKLTGAVGTQAGFGEVGLKIQKLVMDRLGLQPVEVSTQIIQRDRYAELICLLAMLASTLDKFATEIRSLQRTEIGEISEPFDFRFQVGSSTMPHKINPITSERICGLAKVIRGFVIPALENIPSWHERDLTNSSAERFILPTTFILTDYMLNLMNNILLNLHVNEKRMIENLNLTKGRIMSEAVMLALTKKGLGRQEAYKIVRKLVLKSLMEDKNFGEILLSDENIKKMFDEKELKEILEPANYLGTTIEQIEAAIKKTRMERETRKNLVK